MEKNIAVSQMENYGKVNCYVAPIKTVDSGASGKAFEIAVKLYLNNAIRTKNAIASKGKTDTTYHKHTIEIKSGCGTLDNITKSEFVIYSPDSVINNAMVFTSAMFVEIVNACGLVRTKKMTDGTIKTTIQSFKNSNKKNAMFREMLATYGMSLEEFKAIA